MDPERWRQVDRLLQAVLERPPEERDAFLRNACGDDDALEREARSLLLAQQQAGRFLEGPAIELAPWTLVRALGDPAVAVAAGIASDIGAPVLSGRRLGAYQVGARIGAGGMGEVYRAHDSKLGRDVAIKILPSLFTSDPERLARFEREARLLASLNHPHIGAIYGLEEADGIRALVLELVAGETLADRIARGPVRLTQALTIARQIGDALDAAHEKGIIHRDLKPANIMVTPDGVVKVLDFGLAKAAAGDRAAPDRSQSPTMMSGSREGVILGTAAYMSPEQARGNAVDKRTDIWSFGCVLYEMLTGRVVFPGATSADMMAAILEREPDWKRLPATTPPGIRRLLERCLEKDQKRRLRDIGDARIQLDEQPNVVERRRAAWLWPACAALFLTCTAVLTVLYFRQAPPAQQTLTFEISTRDLAPAQMLALSPDGMNLAFVASQDGRDRLWVRGMDTLDARAMAGTDGATFPFWSPDGQHLGFFADGKLKRIAALGGPPQPICDAANSRGGTWSREGLILFSAGPTSPILRVPSTGGVPVAVTSIAEGSGNEGHRFPVFLPDGRHFLYNRGSNNPETSGVFVGSLDGGSPVRLLPDVTNALYAPPTTPGGSGFLLFRRDRTLMAQPFDASRLRNTGEVLPLAEDVALGASNLNTFGAFSIASNGTLVYRRVPVADRQLVWVDRAGKGLGAATELVAFADLSVATPYSLSPDEKSVIMAIDRGGAGSDLWLQDLERDVLNRFTFRAGFNRIPTWSRDGHQVLFSVREVRGYDYSIYRKSVAGSGEELLLNTGNNVIPTDWSPDGQFIIFQQAHPKTALDLWLLPLAGDRKPVPYLQTPSNEQVAQFFPIAGGGFRWMAYQSDESNGNQVYVQDIPAGAAKYQISTAGGVLPRWRPDGKELFYMSADKKLMAVPIAAAGGTLRIGTPAALFMNAGMDFFVPTRDGQRFLINVPAGGRVSTVPPVTVITNWQAGLKK